MASEKKRIPMVAVLLPLVAVLGLAGVMGVNLFRDYQKSEAEDEDTRKQIALEEQTHAKKKKPAPVAAVEVVDAGSGDDEDELSNLPKNVHKKPTGGPVKVATGTPAQKAFAGVKTAYDKLEAANETAAKKFKTQKYRLEDELGNGSPANEAKYVAECDAVKSQILEALRNPENQ
jgi:hypothetical protein